MGKKKFFFEGYKLIYPRLKTSLKWRFDCLIFKKEKGSKNLVDVIQETFTKKYYIVRISQSKRGHIYLIIRKKNQATV